MAPTFRMDDFEISLSESDNSDYENNIKNRNRSSKIESAIFR